MRGAAAPPKAHDLSLTARPGRQGGGAGRRGWRSKGWPSGKEKGKGEDSYCDEYNDDDVDGGIGGGDRVNWW